MRRDSFKDMNIKEHIDSIIARDPSARNRLEVVLCYPSFHSIILHRLSHYLWQFMGLRLPARWISQIARFLTGIEIHPNAKIGKNFFVDHGAAVVIGETAEIGDNVTLYHDVTLGSVSPSEQSHSQRNVKRHPTLGDSVVVASGVKILGPVVVGDNARIGSNAVVLQDVDANTTVVGIPAEPVEKNKDFFPPVANRVLDDSIRKELDALRLDVESLKEKIKTKDT